MTITLSGQKNRWPSSISNLNLSKFNLFKVF